MIRTPDERFAHLSGYPFRPHYLDWQGLRMHYVDEGTGRPVLLLHGEPTWSYLYRKMIPPLVVAGYRCVAPDYIGFGKSDKVVDDEWYTIERHAQSVRRLIELLDLRDVTLVVHDWGGPIGLRQAVDMPERFQRLVILNTWLHHPGSQPSETILKWREYALSRPDLPCGKVVARSLRRPEQDLAAVEAAYDAPFPDAASKAGARRFPKCLPFAEPELGNAADQACCFEALKSWNKPTHFIFSDADPIFPLEWGRRWASEIPGATFDAIAGAGHFLQEEAGEEIASKMVEKIRG